MTVELKEIGNSVEIAAFDVFTERSFVSQFQISEENEEVSHEDNA